MRGQPIVFIGIILLFIFLTDLYAFRSISQVSQGLASRQRMVISGGFWMVTAIMIAWLLYLVISYKSLEYDQFYRYFSMYFGAIVLLYVPKLFFNIFLLLNDIAGLIGALFSSGSKKVSAEVIKISRADFLLQLGLILAAIPFISIFFGMWKGKFNFTVEKLSLKFPNLPEAFHGTRIFCLSPPNLTRGKV